MNKQQIQQIKEEHKAFSQLIVKKVEAMTYQDRRRFNDGLKHGFGVDVNYGDGTIYVVKDWVLTADIEELEEVIFSMGWEDEVVL